MITFGAMAEMATVTPQIDEIQPEQKDYAVFASTSEDHQVRKLKAKIAFSRKLSRKSIADRTASMPQ